MHVTKATVLHKNRSPFTSAHVLALRALSLCAGCNSQQEAEPNTFSSGLQTESYSEARTHFKTTLTRRGPAPQHGEALRAPAGATQVDYSAEPKLKAWISPVPVNNKSGKHPVIVFCHGGLAIRASDWEMTKPLRAAEFVVMAPVLRGENGQPGNYSMFYDEVEDVLSAAKYLAKLPYVDAHRIYVAGHSVGGTLALLSAMASDRFRGAASFSGSPDQVAWSKAQPEVIPFDAGDAREFQMRSPLAFPTSFKCPVRIYYGSKEAWVEDVSKRMAELAKEKKLDVEAISSPRDHFSSVDSAMQQSIEFFKRIG